VIFGKTLVVGVEDDAETGCLRMYIGARYQGLYALIENEQAKEKLRREWAGSYCGNLLIDPPPDNSLYSEKERP
jgi:hypothetical protein